AKILIKTIEDYQLDQYDNIGLAIIEQKQQELNKPAIVEKPQASATQASPANSHPKQASSFNKGPEPVAPYNSADSKEYTVNGCRALKAQGEVDPLTVAFDYNIDYLQLLAFNDMAQGDKFKDGEYIYLQAKKNHGPENTYSVQNG